MRLVTLGVVEAIIPAGLNSILVADTDRAAHTFDAVYNSIPKYSDPKKCYKDNQKQVQQRNPSLLEDAKTCIDRIINGERAGCVHI